MMTVPELLALSNDIEYRALAVQTNALTCLYQPPPPPDELRPFIRGQDFLMFADEALWQMERPERPPVSDRKMFAAGFAFGVCVAGLSGTVFLMLVNT